MDENELKDILRKHKEKGAWFFMLFGLTLLAIHFSYDNHEGIRIMAYSVGMIVVGIAVLFNFVEKVLLDILKKLSVSEKQ